jgi:hypothetical protein
MRAQRVWIPVEPDYGAERAHQALKLVANFHLPDFEAWVAGQKDKVRDWTLVARSELRHLGDFIWEWFCLSFQI